MKTTVGFPLCMEEAMLFELGNLPEGPAVTILENPSAPLIRLARGISGADIEWPRSRFALARQKWHEEAARRRRVVNEREEQDLAPTSARKNRRRAHQRLFPTPRQGEQERRDERRRERDRARHARNAKNHTEEEKEALRVKWRAQGKAYRSSHRDAVNQAKRDRRKAKSGLY